MYMNKKTIVYNFQNISFTLIILTFYILYAVSILGFSRNAPQYIESLDYYVKIYICLFLIYRFNPLRTRIVFTELDRKIVFSAGLFILTTTAISKVARYYLGKARTKLFYSNDF
jgi:uncharacterized membrane protein (DUF4010 family)